MPPAARKRGGRLFCGLTLHSVCGGRLFDANRLTFRLTFGGVSVKMAENGRHEDRMVRHGDVDARVR